MRAFSDTYIPITSKSARSLLSMFDMCYKTGVRDAISIGNEMQCMEFCDKMYASQKFGRIIYDYEYSWKEWKFRLSQLMFEDYQCFRACTKYLEAIVNYKSYLACALPVAMDFYMKGIKDYCNYPNQSLLFKFENTAFVLWDVKLKKLNMNDMIRVLTGFCFDRARLDAEAIIYKRERLDEIEGNHRGRKLNGVNALPEGLTSTSYEVFQREIWKYARIRESRINYRKRRL